MSTEPMSGPPAPLAGIRVIEAGQVLAGPFAGAVLADLGAEVLKIERVDGGDDARRMGPAFHNGDALNFHLFNRGKKSLALDLRSEPGRAGFDALIASADVFVHNLRPGVTDALGIAGPALCARHPRLVYAEISAFGDAGPLRGQPGYEPLLQAFSGLSASNGGPQDPPTRLGASVCDQGAGLWAVVGILALLQQRQHSGRGGIASTSLLETALVWNAQRGDAWLNQGRLPERHASGHPGFVPYEAFGTADEPLLICCGNDRLFVKLAQVLQQPQWPADERFASNRARLQHKAALLPALQALLREQPRAVWLQRLQAAGVPCAPVHTVPQALAHPQVQALGLLQAVPGTDFTLTGLPLSFDGRRPGVQAAGPLLGEHNPEFGLPPLP
jgi:formyl-CoA transferase